MHVIFVGLLIVLTPSVLAIAWFLWRAAPQEAPADERQHHSAPQI
jgi:hypothetical protein